MAAKAPTQCRVEEFWRDSGPDGGFWHPALAARLQAGSAEDLAERAGTTYGRFQPMFTTAPKGGTPWLQAEYGLGPNDQVSDASSF